MACPKAGRPLHDDIDFEVVVEVDEVGETGRPLCGSRGMRQDVERSLWPSVRGDRFRGRAKIQIVGSELLRRRNAAAHP